MFCFNCGTKVDGGARFCPECGVRLADESAVPAGTDRSGAFPQEDTAETRSRAEEKAAAKKRGFIFTNVGQLARRFGVPGEAVSALIGEFILGKKRAGVHYELLDVGDYAFRCSSRRVSLTAQNDVVDFLDVLLDAHNDEVRRGEPESAYLFIIGGHDTIPMPTGPYFEKCSDTDTDADLLYSFPYGREAVAALYSGKIFSYDALFHVGRLPFGPDSGFEALQIYLRNALLADAGEFSCGTAYAQSDPHWRYMSSGVFAAPRGADMVAQNILELPEPVCLGGVILTPPVCDSDGIVPTKAVFDENASIYYFNLHGSDAPGIAYYGGEGAPGSFYAGIYPSYLAGAERLNAVVTEACYGARFIGLPTRASMLLSALSANTVCFLGSSRTAWGDGGNREPKISEMGAADFLSAVFIERLLIGEYDAGTALFEARRGFFGKRNLNMLDYTTLVEFNLFGDPTLVLRSGNSLGKGVAAVAAKSGAPSGPALPAGDRSVSGKNAKIGFTKKSVHADGGASSSTSLLERVRSQVNANLNQIRESVNRHLYENYGVKPRRLSAIFSVKYEDGREEMDLTYEMDDIGELKSLVSVQTDLRGNVESVRMTK